MKKTKHTNIKKISFIIIGFYFLFLVSACAQVPTSDDRQEQQSLVNALPSEEESVPYADFQEEALNPGVIRNASLNGNQLYYSEYNWKEEKEIYEVSVYRKDMRYGGSESLLFTQEQTDSTLVYFMVDAKGNTYYLIKEASADGQLVYHIEKKGTALDRLYSTMLPQLQSQNVYILEGLADKEGNLYLLTSSSQLYCLNTDCSQVEIVNLGGNKPNGILDAGEEGIYLYTIQENSFTFYSVKALQNGEEQTSSYAFENDGISYIPTVGGGCDKGVLISERDILWRFDPETGEKEVALEWNGSNVNVQGRNVLKVSEYSKDIFLAVTYDAVNSLTERVCITRRAAASLPQKTTLTLGVSRIQAVNRLERIVKRFNRQSDEWSIQLKEYFFLPDSSGSTIEKLYLDVMEGNAPDLIDMRTVPVDALLDKGVFENLASYFENSSHISREDLLDFVWQKGEAEDSLIGVMPWFYISTYYAKTNIFPAAGWSYQDMAALIQQYPDACLFPSLSQFDILALLLENSWEDFVDVPTKSCRFDSDEFIEMLNMIKELPCDTENIQKDVIEGADVEAQFEEGNILFNMLLITGMQDYIQLKEKFGDNVTLSGYPTKSGIPYHAVLTDVVLGINSASPFKEGAWTFLEYLLSGEMQTWKDAGSGVFPARKEAFTAYLGEYGDISSSGQEVFMTSSETDIEKLTELVNHCYYQPIRAFDPTFRILDEECGAFFAGDKDAEETARIIQNRVQLYLNEG